ncbi:MULTISPECIES: segregation/condensation protein A [unclassified Streptomyces]|uniref:segregation and condensation protein A n=1 Tax=unclassified Streptomyces TaxID=2593676 RepID=UPI0036806A9D
MTPNDAPASGPGAGRRRALGRGPGTPRPQPPGTPAEPHDAPPLAAAPRARTEPGPQAADGAAPPGPQAPPGAEPGPRAAARHEARPPTTAEPGPATRADASTPALEPTSEPAPESPARAAVEAPAETGTVTGAAPEPFAGAGPSAEAGAGAGAGTGADAAVGDVSEAAAGGVFKVRLANFEGPFDLLLQLISKHKLDVTEVALSKVTDEFMAHIRAMGPDWDLDQTTEFLVVAATLLDLKAARLLPAAQVEDEADLALLEARDLLFARLLQYRAYKQIADIFNGRLDEEARRHPRTVGLEPQYAELLPEVVISIGPEGFARLAVKAMQPKAKPQVYVDHIHAPLVSVQEQAGIVVARLRELGEASFRALVEDTDDTLTVVARFLALLELYREKAVALEQEAALGELLVRWTGGDADAAPMVTDEFDRLPDEPEEKKA